jgi:CheY-like chemotaxis protein
MNLQVPLQGGSTSTEITRITGRNASRPTILVVDDEPQIVGFLSDLLEDEGYRVCNACNGREAMHILQRESPHLVISDLTMPDIDGHQLVYYIHQEISGQAPKVILMSAIERRSPKPGVPFLHKPFDIEDLLDLVDSTLGDGAVVG